MDNNKSSFEIILEKIELILLFVAGFFVLFSMLMVSVDVFLRNIFNSPIPGVYELVGFLFVSAVGLGLPFAQAQKENISINIVTKYFPIKVQKVLVTIAYFIAIISVAILFWESSKRALESFQMQDYTMGLVHFPLWPPRGLLAIGLFILLIRLVIDQFNLIKDKDFDEENY